MIPPAAGWGKDRGTVSVSLRRPVAGAPPAPRLTGEREGCILEIKIDSLRMKGVENMSGEICLISGREYVLRIPKGGGPFPLAVLCGGDMREELDRLAAGRSPRILLSPSASWERDYTPWPAQAPAGRAPFLGGGPAFLEEIQVALEILEARLPILPGRESRAILGYSLGGLFALWAFCAGETFGAAASLSGSLWYEGWTEYLAAHLPEQGGRVYLSLGKKEEKSGPAQMRLVGERTRETAGMFRAAGRFGEVPLEMHGGGHFTDIPGRWRRAMEWLDGEEILIEQPHSGV